MAGLDPAIHVFFRYMSGKKTWMPATSAGMTRKLAGLAVWDPNERPQMKKPTVKYSKGEIGRTRIVGDFLPSPGRLVLREENGAILLR